MAELTGKEKRELRSQGRRMPALVRVGKAGLSAALHGQLADALSRQELVKVRLQAASAHQRQDQAERLAAAVGATLVEIVGSSALLYRPRQD
ncbi:MAG: YhbY family RNA-binding protein [Planctomycetota bacterium]